MATTKRFRRWFPHVIPLHKSRTGQDSFDNEVISTNTKTQAREGSTIENSQGLLPKTLPLPKSQFWWSPTLFHRSFLLTIVGTFILLSTGLILLYYLSSKQDGLTMVTENHFLWTYGPTVIFTVVVAVWRQLDFHCKVLTPWAELRRGNVEASRSILLDYVSPLQIISLSRALHKGHLVPAVTVIGFVILKLITLTSTGLLTVRSTTLSNEDANLVKTTSLDGSLYNSSSNSGLFDPSLAYTAYAVMAKGLSYVEGTDPDLVYEQFSLPHNATSTNTAIIAEVNAIVPTFHCESAPVAINLQPANTTDQHPEDSLQLLFPECTLRNGGAGTPVFALNPRDFRCPPRQLSPLMQQIDCVKQTTTVGPENWQLLTLADFRYQQTLADSDERTALGASVQATSWSTEVQQVVGIACRSGYTIEKVRVTYELTRSPPSITTERLANGNISFPGNFTEYDLGTLTTSALMAASDMFGNLLDNEAAEEYPNTLFKMMAATEDNSYESLLNETAMMHAAEMAFQQVAIQSTSKYLLRRGNSSLLGTIVDSENRLHIDPVSLWIMFSGCLLMVLVAIFICFRLPGRVVTVDPQTLSSAAAILAPSRDFQRLLTSNEIREALGHNKDLDEYRFSSTLRGGVEEHFEFQIEITRQAERQTSDDDTEDGQSPEHVNSKWWHPLTIRRPVLAVTLVLPPCVLVVLEVLQRVSERQGGIISFADQASTTTTICTRFAPALIMLLTATLVNSLDFNVSVLAPFNALRSRALPAEQSIMISVVDKTPLIALWTALKCRFWDVLFSTSAALIASVLTIVVSGLYTIDTISSSQEAVLGRADYFNTSWANSAMNDSSAAVVSSLTESLGLGYPPFTYEELALPSIKSRQSPSTSDANSQALLNVQLPSLRASLSCVALSSEMVNASSSYNPRIESAGASVFASMPLPATCPYGGPGGNLTRLDFSQSFTLRGNTSYVGKLLDLHVGPYDPIQASSAGELSPSEQKDNPPGCPSLAFIYGYADANDPAQTSITTLVCYQLINQIQANVTFTWPDLSIPPSRPPVPDESSLAPVYSGPNRETTFQYRLQLHMDNEFSSFNQTTANASTTSGSLPSLDNFFQGVLFGRYPVPATSLATTDHNQTSIFYAIQGLYRRYMAQAISGNMRVPVLDSNVSSISVSDTTSFTGAITNPFHAYRLQQNPTTKLLLQLQLGAIFVLCSLAVYMARLHQHHCHPILPYNPCTIVGVAALFAGSRTCDLDSVTGRSLMPQGVQSMNEQELGLLWRGWQFKLGWWETELGTLWYGIDSVKASKSI